MIKFVMIILEQLTTLSSQVVDSIQWTKFQVIPGIPDDIGRSDRILSL